MHKVLRAQTSLVLALALVALTSGVGAAWAAPPAPVVPSAPLLALKQAGDSAAVTELTPAFPAFGTPGYTQWMGAISSAREFVSMPKQSLHGHILKVSYSYEYNGRSDGVLCGADDDCLVHPHDVQELPAWQLGGEWAFLGTSKSVGSYGHGDWTDRARPSGKAVRYRLGVPTGSIRESVNVRVSERNGPWADVEVRIVRSGTLSFTLPAIKTKKKLYFGLNDHPSTTTAIFGGDHVRDQSPYRLAAYEHAAWWTSGQLRSPTSAAPSSPQPTVPVPVEPVPPPGDRFAALGDSYSSGEGLRPFTPVSNTSKNTCHRSGKAYSQLVSPQPNIFVACSGQRAKAYFDTVMEAPQREVLSRDTGLVTMTLGGNDLEWTKLLASCIKVQAQVVHATLHYNRKKCQAKLATMPDRQSAMRSALMRVYADALNQAPNAQIRILNYPPLFPDRGKKKNKDCRIARINVPVVSPTGYQLSISGDVEQDFVEIQGQANWVVAQAVNWARTYAVGGSRLELVDVTENFGHAQGHTSSCGDSGRPKPWINSIKLEASEAREFASDIRHGRWDKLTQDVLTNSKSGSYHPTTEGQRQMYLALARHLPAGWR